MDGKAMLRRTGLIVTALVAALIVSYALLNLLAARRLTALAVENGMVIKPGFSLHLNPFTGTAELLAARVDSTLQVYPESISCYGRIDTVRISGLSIIQWLLRHELDVDDVLIVADSLRVKLPDQRLGHHSGEWTVKGLHCARVHVRLHAASLSLGDSSDTRIELVRLGLDAEEWRSAASEGGRQGLGAIEANVEGARLVRAQEDLALFESLQLDKLRGALAVTGLHYGPEPDSIRSAASQQELEQDVISARLDTLRVSRIALERLINGERCEVGQVMVSGGEIHIARDKSLPDPNWSYRPLPARTLRSAQERFKWDDVRVSGLAVTYWERGVKGGSYARIPFTGIQASLGATGKTDADSTHTTLLAQATAFDETPVRLHVAVDPYAAVDNMEIRAQIGSLPLRDLQQATGALAGIEPSHGFLDTLTLHMEVNDRNGGGSIWTSYSDLKVQVNPKGGGKALRGITSALLNAVIVSDRNNARDNAGAVEFSFERRRDRGFFNALWTGLKSGMKVTMLPRTLTLGLE